MKKKQMARKAKAERKLAQVIQKQSIALEKGSGAWKDENHPDLKTPEDSTAYVRAIRDADRARQERLEKLMRE